MIKKKSGEVYSSVIVFALLFLHRILLFYSLNINYTFDSYDYIARDGFAFLTGNVDRYRLPVYPMIIDIFQRIFTRNIDMAICIFQMILSLLSIVVLYLTVKKITKNHSVSLVVTSFYSTLASVGSWDKILLTESISLSLTVFILYGIISYLMDYKLRYVALTSALLVIGCFLRAVFVIYAGMFLGALILILVISLFAKKTDNIKDGLIGIGLSAVPVILVLIYACCFCSNYGAYTISDSGLGQQLYIVLQYDMYRDCTDNEISVSADEILNSDLDQEGSKDIDSDIGKRVVDILNEQTGNASKLHYLNKYSIARMYIMETFSREEVKSFVDVSMKNHRDLNIYRILTSALDEFSMTRYNRVAYDRGTQTLYNILTVTSLISFNLIPLIVIALIEVVVFFYNLLRKKKQEWIRLGLGAFIMSTVVLALVGTNDEYARTAITSLPFMFTALGLYISAIVNKLSHR